ncbi:unnamed protein product [Adineta ricciae]|uniref:Uncharacterized protein n=1 Tax=Adineta ricciae TaxID=249248 RepID=A0A814F7J9_ADIRI|nr:unnamed protein product [Adineta ricciae]
MLLVIIESNDGPPPYEEVIGLPAPIGTIIEPPHPVRNPIRPERHNSLRCYITIACILIISLAVAITLMTTTTTTITLTSTTTSVTMTTSTVMMYEPNVYNGPICGLKTGAGNDCADVDTNRGCPQNYIHNTWNIGKTGTGVMAFCGKRTTDKNVGFIGTICGLATGSAIIRCGGRNPYSEPCPTGYTGPTCNGYFPDRGACPSGCRLEQWRVDFGNGIWSFCIKN